MKPRFASATISTDSYVKQVFRCSVGEWKRLPVQWRGFVLFNQQNGQNAQKTLEMIDKGNCSTEYDPQGVFDAYQGLAPV